MTKNTKTTMNSCRFVVLALAVCMLAACIGCADIHTVQFTYQPGVAAAPTLPCPVALSLGEEFKNYDCVVPWLSMRYTRPCHISFGPALQKYATYVAQSVFGEVQVLDGQPPRSDAKLLLVPRVTSLEYRPGQPGILGWGPSGELRVQWDFNDPTTGQTLFSIHVQSESSHSLSLSRGIDLALPYVAGGLMTNLTSTTIEHFGASKDIQRLCGH